MAKKLKTLSPTIKIFAGNSNLALAQKITQLLKMPLGKALVNKFSDDEIRVEIQEPVRNCSVFVLQSLCSPVNHHLMELLLMVDALKRAGASQITALIPYLGYARQDKRKDEALVPISAKVVADLLHTVGVSRVITLDIHSEQIQGFFCMPIDNIQGSKVLLKVLMEDMKKERHKYPAQSDKHSNLPVIVSPDIGGVLRARDFAKQLHNNTLAIIDKRRSKPNQAKVMHVIGNVKDKHCFIVDDIIDTGGTLCLAAKALKEQGAKKVSAYITHPVLSDGAVQLINKSAIDELVVTDTIPLKSQAKTCPKIRQISAAEALALAISDN